MGYLAREDTAGNGAITDGALRRAVIHGAVVASFTVGPHDQIMLVSDGGTVMRCPIDDIRIAGRSTQGVVVFKVGEGERVVSVTRLLRESEIDEDGVRAVVPCRALITTSALISTATRGALISSNASSVATVRPSGSSRDWPLI